LSKGRRERGREGEREGGGLTFFRVSIMRGTAAHAAM
jgi:hypothetical protein